MENLIKYGIYSVFALSLFCLYACGGSGGGDNEFVGAGTIKLTLAPAVIDAGDRALVTAEVEDVNNDGVILKFRFPDGLYYVLESSLLEVDDEEIDIGPAANMLSGSDVYLVYFLSQEIFGENKKGKISFQLEGSAKVSNGEVEVDMDVNDSLIADAEEFNIEAPEFQVEAAASINVDA